jgi:hypothetical protein
MAHREGRSHLPADKTASSHARTQAEQAHAADAQKSARLMGGVRLREPLT